MNPSLWTQRALLWLTVAACIRLPLGIPLPPSFLLPTYPSFRHSKVSLAFKNVMVRVSTRCFGFAWFKKRVENTRVLFSTFYLGLSPLLCFWVFNPSSLIFVLHPFLFIHAPIFPDDAKHTIPSLLSEPIQQSSAVTVTPVSPMPTSLTSLQPPSEDQQSFVTLPSSLALSLNGEEYVLNLAEDEGITDLFSSVDLDHFPLDMPIL